MADGKQNPLLPENELSPETKSPPPMPSDASLQAALGVFENHMRDEGFSINTMKAFSSDIRLLGKYLGIGQPVGEIGTKNLNDFLDWLLNDRGVPCSPKSYARRVTTLKVFFGWLHESGVLPNDPSAAIIQRTVTSPLPTLPKPKQIDDAVQQAERIRQGRSLCSCRKVLSRRWLGMLGPGWLWRPARSLGGVSQTPDGLLIPPLRGGWLFFCCRRPVAPTAIRL